MASYYKCKELGEGTYAKIFLAKETKPAESRFVESEPSEFTRHVAIKKIKKSAYSLGQEISALREIRALKALNSEYVVGLFDIFVHDNSIHLVLEYVEFDLEQVLKNKSLVIMPGDIKAWMYMLLSGLLECHGHWLIHRDIKPNNMLIRMDGTLKLADFGLTRRISSGMTAQAVTRWYRAPEMLFGATSYAFAVDMWAVGCVFAEMFLRVPFFAGDSDVQQLSLVFQALGTPSERDWPLARELPGYSEMKKMQGPPLETLFTAADEDALDLMRRLLTFDPARRITCIEALKHRYFTCKPSATPIGSLPVPK